MKYKTSCYFFVRILPLFIVGYAFLFFPTITYAADNPAATNPHVLFNSLEIADLKKRIEAGEQPISTHYRVMRDFASQSLTGVNVYNGNDSAQYRTHLDLDAPYMFYHAMLYALDGNEDNAKRTRDLLVAWAQGSLTNIQKYENFEISGREDAAMFFGRAMFDIVPAFDLIYQSPSLSSTDKTLIRNWLNKIYTLLHEGTNYWASSGVARACHKYSNHVTAHVSGMLLIGYMLEDRVKIQEALSGSTIPVNWYKLLQQAIYMDNDQIVGCEATMGNPTYTGEAVDRYRHYEFPGTDPMLNKNRGFGYSLLTILNLAIGAEAAYHHGVDLYQYSAPTGESLLLSGSYYAPYIEAFSPGDKLITTKNIKGEASYVNEVMFDGYIRIFEVLSARYANPVSITRAFANRSTDNRIYFENSLFGKTYNPERISWDFFLDNITEGWHTTGGAISIRNGTAKLMPNTNQFTLTSLPLNIQAQAYDTMTIRMNTNGITNTVGRIIWNNSVTQEFQINTDNKFYIYTIPLSNNSNWTGRISQMQIVLPTTIHIPVIIDSITLKKTTSLPGDLNGDGSVNLLDFNLLISKFNHSYTLLDFNAIIANYRH